MNVFPTSLRPLEGGFSGETFLADAAGEQVVVRVYGARSAARGPGAPEVDAAVLELVRGVLPVASVLEVRRGDPVADLPGLLVTSLLPGERLDLVLPRLGDDGLAEVGRAVGRLVARLGHMVQPRPGAFADRSLTLQDLPMELRDLSTWLEARCPDLREHLGEDVLRRLRPVADAAQDLLDTQRRHVLVHYDLNPKNVLVDPGTLEITGLLDWEFAHSGSPWTDLGNVLRFEHESTYALAVVAAYRELLPGSPEDLLDLARAADLFALLDLAPRDAESEVATGARALLRAIAETGDLHAGGDTAEVGWTLAGGRG